MEMKSKTGRVSGLGVYRPIEQVGFAQMERQREQDGL